MYIVFPFYFLCLINYNMEINFLAMKEMFKYILSGSIKHFFIYIIYFLNLFFKNTFNLQVKFTIINKLKILI